MIKNIDSQLETAEDAQNKQKDIVFWCVYANHYFPSWCEQALRPVTSLNYQFNHLR